MTSTEPAELSFPARGFAYFQEWEKVPEKLREVSKMLVEWDHVVRLSDISVSRDSWSDEVGFRTGSDVSLSCGLVDFEAIRGSVDPISAPATEVERTSGTCEYVSILVQSEHSCDAFVPAELANLLDQLRDMKLLDISVEETVDVEGWRITVYYSDPSRQNAI